MGDVKERAQILWEEWGEAIEIYFKVVQKLTAHIITEVIIYVYIC